MMRYDTLLLDADGTLLDFERAQAESLCAAFDRFRLPFSPEIRERYHMINQALWEAFERGEISRDDIQLRRFTILLSELGETRIDPMDFNEAYRLALSQNGTLYDDALPLCRTLHQSGARMYLVTNGFAFTQHGRLDHSPLLPYFSGVFISEEVGFRKPQREFFDIVLRAAAPVDLTKTLVIGDSLTSDIRGAANAGLDACWFNPAGLENPAQIPCTHEIRRLGELIPLVTG